MATQTHQRRSVVTQSRAHDHLYDPIYTASGTHNPYPQYSTRPIPSWNATSELASTQTAQTIRFSAIHSAADATAQRTAHRQHAQQTRALYKQEQAHQQDVLHQQVLGRDRTKFIKRPVVPYLEPVVAGLLQNPTSLEEQVINHQEQEQEITMTRTIGIQTDYRESETQTDPYTADYITSPDDPEPELLALAHLTYGAGLPASLDEIQLIQRMREKRAFEASLPPISDAASFELRKKLLEERELAEWSIREAEMKKEQEDRLAILVQTLAERERVSEELAEARIDKLRQSKLAERDDTFDAIHRDRIKQDRQLLHENDGREEKIKSTMIEHQLHKPTHRRDIIAEYGDHASQVYAPVAREGKLPVKNQVVDYGIPLLSNFQGLSELERSLPAHLRDITISAPTKIIPASLSTRKGQQIANDLAYVDRLLDRKKEDHKPPVIENVYKKFEPLQRAATPSVTAPAHDAESVAALLLQRLIRGRAIQNIMYEGKQHHIHLIRELRLAEHPPEAQREVDVQHDVNVALDTLQGELISNALDFVSKEIVRVNEEQKIAALVKEATFVRRHREAEESGRRQAEDVMRMKQQQQFEMTMADHQATADRYLTDILSSAVSSYAHRHASQDASLRAAHVAPILTTIENEQEDAERIVNDLVASFVLPEVERRREKRAEDLSSRRFIDQAHHSVLYAVQQTLLRYQQKLLEKNGTTSTSPAPATTKT